MAKKKSKRVNFSKYKPIHDRRFNPAYMEQLQDSLIARNYNEPQRLAFLATALHESGGDPKAVAKGKDKNGKSVKFSGLYQWGDDRFPNSWNLGDQIHYALESAESNDTRKSWTDGGSGVPYIRRASEGRDAFWNSKNPYDATLYFNKGYVRPAEEQARINRAEEAANMAKNLFWPGGPLETLAANPSRNNTGYVLSPEQEALLKEHNNSVSVPNMNKVRTVATQNVAPILDEGPDLEQVDTSGIFKKTWGEQSSEAWNNAWKSENIGNSLTSIAGGLTDITQSTMANAKIKDTTGVQTAIDTAANTTFGGSTNEQLMSQYDAIEDLDRTSQRDLTGSVGSKLANTGKATLSGVQAGMQIGGPIGGIIGGAAGLISSGIGWITGDTKAQNEAERLNREAEAAEQRRLANFDLAVNNLEQQNLMYDMANYAKYGGPLFNEFSNGITKINEGGSHESNPNEGIQVGVDNENIPNLVEEGEVIFNDYVFSNRLVVPDKVRTKYKLRDTKDLSFADAAKDIQKMSEEMPNDPIVKRTMETQMQELMMEQEQVRMKKDKNKRKNKFAKGGIMSPLEYIEPALSVGQGLQSLFIKPDYSYLDAYKDAINAANVKISSSPVKTNMRYTPMDTRGLLSEASANRAATNRALMNTSGANPAIARTALTNTDYNYNNQLGKLWRSIEEAEYNRQLGFEQFRTNLENANRARDLQVAGINADILAKNAALRGDYANRQLAIDNATSAVISGNIDAAKQSLAGLARQSTNDRMLQMLINEGYFYNPAKYKKNGGKIKRRRRLS